MPTIHLIWKSPHLFDWSVYFSLQKAKIADTATQFFRERGSIVPEAFRKRGTRKQVKFSFSTLANEYNKGHPGKKGGFDLLEEVRKRAGASSKESSPSIESYCAAPAKLLRAPHGAGASCAASGSSNSGSPFIRFLNPVAVRPQKRGSPGGGCGAHGPEQKRARTGTPSTDSDSSCGRNNGSCGTQ